MSEASVTILVGASGFRCERVALASASLMATNAEMALSFHCTFIVLSFTERRSRGYKISAQPWMKRW